jgi:hypothetical protein
MRGVRRAAMAIGAAAALLLPAAAGATGAPGQGAVDWWAVDVTGDGVFAQSWTMQGGGTIDLVTPGLTTTCQVDFRLTIDTAGTTAVHTIAFTGANPLCAAVTANNQPWSDQVCATVSSVTGKTYFWDVIRIDVSIGVANFVGPVAGLLRAGGVAGADPITPTSIFFEKNPVGGTVPQLKLQNGALGLLNADSVTLERTEDDCLIAGQMDSPYDLEPETSNGWWPNG